MNAAPDSFLSLARKWRPQTFSELVGHDYTARVLQNAARESRLHHAFLFTGTRGVGKTTLARIVAKMANCENVANGEPCLQCEMCRQIAAGKMLDVVELDAASHTKVEEMRTLLEGANYPPVQGKCKVFIIDEAHMLSKSAFAAMLKTLEEPPGYLKFVLATTDMQKLPATILSRCLCFALRPLERGQIAARLSEILRAEKREFNEDAVQTVARLARGSMRDALSILEQALAHDDGKLRAESVRRITGDLDFAILADILRAVANGRAEAIPDFVRRLRDDGAGYDAALSRLAALLYKIALFRAAPDAAAESAEERDVVESLAPLYDEDEIQMMYEIAVRGRRQLQFAPDEQTGFEMTVLRMMCFAPRDSEAESESDGGNRGKPAARSVPPAAKAAEVAKANTAANVAPPPETKNESEYRAGGGANGEGGADDSPEIRWRRIREKLRGTARALADLCIPLELSGNGAVLRVDKSQAHNRKIMLPELEKQLREIYHPQFRVALQNGEDDGAAAREKELRDAAMRTPFVRDLLAVAPEAKLIKDDIEIHPQGGAL